MLQKFFASLVAVFALALLFVAVPQQVHAACGSGDSIRSGIDCAPASQQSKTVEGGLKSAVNTLLFVVGVAAVIVILVGGLRFILAGGNAQTISSARDTVLYAVIGLVVALLAYAIVNFVLTQFGS